MTDILIISTGGTIGSSFDGSHIETSPTAGGRLIQTYKTHHENSVRFSTVSPYEILSENLDARALSCLIQTIRISLEKYDGIIVTHGTDTLQYAACAVGYAFGAKTIPIVFVSANYILDDSRSNGFSNFFGAVDFISGKNGQGVFVCYQNTNGPVLIHRATRLLPHDPYSDCLRSVRDSFFGTMAGGVFTPNPFYSALPDAVFPLLPDDFSSAVNRVLVVDSRPGGYLSLSRIDLCGIRSVLLLSYHSGTVNTSSKELAVFCRRLTEQSANIFLCGADPHAPYASKTAFSHLGITELPALSPIAAYIKAVMLSHKEKSDAAKIMASPLSEDVFIL